METFEAQTIRVNGKTRLYHRQTVRELLAASGIPTDRPDVAVAINAAVVPRAQWDTVYLEEDDHVEIVRAFAGG